MDIITINGVDFYIPEDYSHYVVEVAGTLTLSKTGNVTLYSSLTEYNNSNSGYPRIQLQYGQKARYSTRTGQQTFTQDLTLNSWSFKNKNKLSDPFLLIYLAIAILGLIIWRSFKR